MITSTSNSQIKEIIQLNKKTKERNKRDVFVIEGIKMFKETPPSRIVKVYMAKSFSDKMKLSDDYSGIPCEIVEDRVFKNACDTLTPQGILCLVKQQHYLLEDMLKSEFPQLLILEDIQDPGNLGTILRTSEAAGVNGVILSKKSVDIYNPKTIRSTMGSIYRVPFIYIEEIQSILPILREKNITTYAAALENSSMYDDYDYKTGSAFLIGNEGNGLSNELINMADQRIYIPMQGQIESLNAAVAASILIYEAYRQRR